MYIYIYTHIFIDISIYIYILSISISISISNSISIYLHNCNELKGSWSLQDCFQWHLRSRRTGLCRDPGADRMQMASRCWSRRRRIDSRGLAFSVPLALLPLFFLQVFVATTRFNVGDESKIEFEKYWNGRKDEMQELPGGTERSSFLK